MRICSLLPSATEIVCALGLFDQLVAVSHECDYPSEVRSRPVVTSSRVETEGRSSAEIDAFVSTRLHEHAGIYTLDEQLLKRLQPDLILTQELCDVCAVSYEQVQTAVRALRGDQTVLSLEPSDLAGVLATITALGEATEQRGRAAVLVRDLQTRLTEIGRRSVAGATRPKVACLEWLDPPYSAGHWVPEMVEIAGGIDVLAASGERSRRLHWQEVLDAAPDVVILMPCGFGVERAVVEYQRASLPAGWNEMPAVIAGRVYAVDANAYFSRPGPRLLEGMAILQRILSGNDGEATLDKRWLQVPKGS